MRVLLASPRSTCAGVNMAIEALERAVRLFGAPMYVYHEIVHNRLVVEGFQQKGVIFVNHIHEVPPGSHLMYSAHGVSPDVQEAARQRRLQIVDATCPLVRKVHLEAVRFARQGYTIVLFGHRGHDEVVGTLGEAPGQIVLIESLAEIDTLEVADPRKVAYLSQTTLSVDEVSVLVERLLERFPESVGAPQEDICYATQNRQEAIKALLPQADVVLVIGSGNSSNTSRLVEIAREQGRPAYRVDSVADVQPEWFLGDPTVLITAGASAPESLVAECVEYLQQAFQASVEEHVIRHENVEFQLPLAVR